MMYDNILKLKNDVSGCLMKLGVNQALRETPAYDTVLLDIGNMLNSMGISELEEKRVEVIQENHNITISFSRDKERFHFEIYADNDRITCRCIRKREFMNQNLNYYHKDMMVNEIKLKMVETGECIMNYSSGYIDNKNGSLDQCRKKSMGSVAYFDEYGNENFRTLVTFQEQEISYGFENMMSSDALHHLPEGNYIPAKYDNILKHIHVSRDDIHIAHANVLDYENNSEYSAFLPLNPEIGLAYLTWPSEKMLEQVDIPELSPEQMEDMIQKEKHLKAREGLIKMAASLHGYSR